MGTHATAPDRHTTVTSRLGKRHVEALLAAYDADPVGALTAALRHVFQAPTADWAHLVALGDFEPDRAALLVARDVRALDELAAELNEMRTIGS
jgi:hypothetical protein